MMGPGATSIQGASVAVLLVFAATSSGQIIGSSHDFTGAGWAQAQSCLPCHTPHNASRVEINGYAAGRLWNHSLPAPGQIYKTYAGDVARNEALDSYSILCMGCHDGTVALDSFGGDPGSTFLTGGGLVGTDLTKQHPVGVSAAWPEPESSDLNPRHTWENQVFGNSRMGRLRLMMVDGVERSVVSCATCHEPHGRGGHEYLLRIDNASSQLCFACHAK